MYTVYKPRETEQHTEIKGKPFSYHEALSWQNILNSSSSTLPFYETIILPLYSMLRLSGSAPFYVTNEGHLKYKKCSLIMAYSIIIYVVIGMSAMLSVYDIAGIPKSSFNGLIDKVIVCAMIIPQLILPVISWLEMSKHQKYLEKWIKFEEMFKEVTGYSFSTNCIEKCIRQYLIVFFLQSVVVLITSPMYLLEDMKWYHLPGYVFSMVRYTIFFAYWYTTSVAISKVSKKYKKCFEQEVSKNLGYTSSIDQYRLLWMRLSQLVQKCGSCNGFSVSLYLLMNIMYLLVTSYEMAFDVPENLKKGRYEKIIGNTLCSLFWLLSLIVYCDAGYKMSLHSSQGMLQVILKLKDSPQWNMADEPRMNIFLYTLSEYKPITTVSGYFIVNRSLFGSIITALVTYMIVLIQFDIAAPNPKADVLNVDSNKI